MNDQIKDMFSQILKTRVHLTAMTLGASGWQAGQVNPALLAGPLVRLYVWDRPSNWTWMCAVPKASFDDLAQKALQRKDMWEAIRGGVAYLIQQTADKSPSADWEQQLGQMLTAYAGTTQTLEAARGLPSGGHFIVCNYRKAGEADGKLRPFVLSDSSPEPLSVPAFHQAIKTVLALDQERHPEWLGYPAARPATP